MGFGNNTFGTDTMYVHYEKLLEALLKYAELSPVPVCRSPDARLSAPALAMRLLSPRDGGPLSIDSAQVRDQPGL